MAYLTLRGINKIYPNGFHAVRDFNLEIEKGEFVVLVGSSGCGKSTTLRMIAGLESISRGDFYIGGEKANELDPRERGVAMVFQSYALYPHMTVFDNLAFGLMLQGADDDVIEEKVEKTASVLGLSEYLERMPRELSGGQRQRVAVGRAMIRKADIFLMDEPLSNLDAKQRVTMRSEITQIHRQTGATTIYVTHDQTEAMTMADKIVVMKDGCISQVGTPFDLYFEPANMFVAGFIGDPPMNLIESRVINGRPDIPDNSVDLRNIADSELLAGIEGKEIVFGFRPEAIKLKAEADSEHSFRMTSTVELTELLGDSTNVYVDMSGIKSILKADPHVSPNIGEVFEFYIPYDSVYLFDKQTQKRIRTSEKRIL